MRLTGVAILAATMISAGLTTAQAEVKIIASIKPIQSLVAGVMQGVGTPAVIIEGAASPHTYALKPSQASQLQQADIVFWIGSGLEAFLEKPINTIATKAVSISLMDTPGITKLKFRDGGMFESHDHDHDEHGDEHGHDDHEGHDEHGHDKHKDHAGHADHSADADHRDSGVNPHIWLDPINAKAMIDEIEKVLSKTDPVHAKTYAKNAEQMRDRLDALTSEITTELAPVKGRGYVVFHDAYPYFENRFGIAAVGSITVSPEILPGAERVAELQAKIRRFGAACLFSEPQFEPKLITTITENTKAVSGVLDPLGTSLANGPDLYFTLLRTMARSLKACLLRTE